MSEPSSHSRTCPYCGAPVHAEASFCPHCARSLIVHTQLTPPNPTWHRILRRALFVLFPLLLAVGLAAWYFSSRPQVYSGQAEVFYTDSSGTYQLLLTNSGQAPASLEWVSYDAVVGTPYRVPAVLYIYDVDSGAAAGPQFLEKIQRITAEFLPAEGNGSTFSCTAPAAHSAFPDAAFVSFMDFVAADDFTAQMLWTITMQNGDNIRLCQQLTITATSSYDYSSEDAPMGTTEELQALLDEISASVDRETEVNIYLPAVTYEGDLVIQNRPFNLYGSTGGDQRTVFTGSIQIDATADAAISHLEGIEFRGNGEGTAISTQARTWAINCTFTNWETGFYGSDWVNVIGCTFENNQIAFQFNCIEGSANHSMYNDNIFRSNGTAVLLENVPTDLTLNFQGCLFSGNQTDLDNRCQQSVDISQAIFES